MPGGKGRGFISPSNTPLAVEVGQGVAEIHGRNRGPEVVTGQLLTSTNSEPPVHFQTLEKGYPEDGTITVIINTDTHLEGWSGGTELMAWKPDLDQRIFDAGNRRCV